MAAGECWIFDTWRPHRVINAADDERVHLVADTVGSPMFWDLVENGRAHGSDNSGDWSTRAVPRMADTAPLRFESVNIPKVMTPWEMREHLGFLLRHVLPHPQLATVQQILMQLQRVWQALWAEYGDDRAGWPLYRKELDAIEHAIERAAAPLQLVNGTHFLLTLRAMVLKSALADHQVAVRQKEPRAPAISASS